MFLNVLVDAMAFDSTSGTGLDLLDGLYRYIDEDELMEEVPKAGVAETVDRLITMANQRGGRDNISVVVIEAEGDTGQVDESTTVRRMEVLGCVGLFQFCTYRELMKVPMAESRTVPAGAVLFDEGDHGREAVIEEARWSSGSADRSWQAQAATTSAR